MKNFLMISFAVISMMASGCGMGAYGSIAGVPYSTGGYGTPTYGGTTGGFAASTSCGIGAPCATFYAMNEAAALVTVSNGMGPIAQFTVSPYGPSRIAVPVGSFAQYTYSVRCQDLRGDISPHVFSSPVITGGARIDLVPSMCY